MSHIIDFPSKSSLVLIAALSRTTRGIGKDGKLLWDIPEDLQHFKKITSGHPVIMGRRTWESIPEKFRPLPGRTNIIVTRSGWYEAPGAIVTHSFPEALSYARDAAGADEIFAIGGQEIYQCALPFTDRLYLTLVESDAPADAFFPAYEEDFKNVVEDTPGESNGLSYSFVTLEKS